MISITTVCDYHDDPAVIVPPTGGALIDVRVRSVVTGRTIVRNLTRTDTGETSLGEREYVRLDHGDLPKGEPVAVEAVPYTEEDIERWFRDDHEVGLREYVRGTVACLTTTEGPRETTEEPRETTEEPRETTEDAPAGHEEPSEASEDVREPEAPQEDAEDRRITTDNVYHILKEHPEGMTTRDIAGVLGMDTRLNGTRVRINQKLNKLSKSGYIRQVGTRTIPTGQSVPVWEAVE